MERSCECGCEGEPKQGKRYIHGHSGNKRTNRRSWTCEHCSVVFVRKVKKKPFRYCSLQCLGAARKARRPTFSCIRCGKTFSTPQYRARQGLCTTFCSRECSRKRWHNQRHTNPTKYASYKTTAFEIYSRDCQVCGYNRHPELILVHHKDGNHYNNLPGNLTVLCPTCHAEAHLALSGLKYVPPGIFGGLKRWRSLEKPLTTPQ